MTYNDLKCKKCNKKLHPRNTNGYCMDCRIARITKNIKYCKVCGKRLGATNKYGYCKNCKSKPKCIDCGKILQRWDAKRCRSCSKKGFLHSQVKHGKSFTQQYCKCGAKITKQAKMCLSCLYKKRSKNMLKKWSNPEYKQKVIEKWMKNALVLPNKPEKQLIKILQTILPKEYKYVGDGQVLLKGFNPDFINVNGQKKIIEHFGCYWHNYQNYVKTGKYLASDRQRLGAYKSLGYKTLIIWEHELQDLKTVKEKLKKFSEVI